MIRPELYECVFLALVQLLNLLTKVIYFLLSYWACWFLLAGMAVRCFVLAASIQIPEIEMRSLEIKNIL